MVERVAKVLAARKWPHVGGAAGDSLVTGTPNWKFCVGDARAVIEALMEPTPEMVLAGERAFTGSTYLGLHQGQLNGLIAAYGAMLRTALSQPNEEGEGK